MSRRLFEPEVGSLAGKIEAGLKNQLPPPAKRYDLEESRRLWGEFCRDAVAMPGLKEDKVRPAPRVGVFFQPSQQEENFNRVSDSLAAQSCKNITVTLVQTPEAALPEQLQPKCEKLGWKVSQVSAFGHEDALAGNDYLVVLTSGCVPKASAIETLVSAMEFSGADALSCCAEIHPEGNQQAGWTYEPLGACLEGGLFVNLFGSGCVIIKRSVLQKAAELPNLLAPQELWKCLARLAVAKRSIDVVPELLASGWSREFEAAVTSLDYARHMEIIESYTPDSPRWLRYLLVNAVAAERRIGALEHELSLREKMNPGRIAYKIKRETKRLVKQCKGLLRRE